MTVEKENRRNTTKKIQGVLSLLLVLALFGFEHISQEELVLSKTEKANKKSINIDAVFFAQTHVAEPDYTYFTLVGNRKTLIKAHVISEEEVRAPKVEAIVRLNGKKLKIRLQGPSHLPSFIESDSLKVVHSYADSFTGTIPKELLQPGMTVEIKAGKETKAFNELEIGAPTVLKMNLIDIACFENEFKAFPEGWEKEFESRIPIAELKVDFVRAFFKEIVLAPDTKSKIPAKRCYSEEETDRGEKTSSRWMKALIAASGTAGRTNMYYLSSHHLKIKYGRGADFHGLGRGGMVGYIAHECGHGMSLPHCNQGHYPYNKGTYNGVYTKKQWVGSTWGFCLWNGEFMPPTFGEPKVYKKSPMLGGGQSDKMEEWAMLKHFSDYEVQKMKNYLEGHVVVWDKDKNSWMGWNTKANDYTTTVENDGVQYPVKHDVEVISVLTSVSAVTPEANIVYPPIGPYNTGLIRLFDPRNSDDRAAAEKYFAPTEGCDVTLKITQGGKVKYAMLAIPWDESVDPFSGTDFFTNAVNLPASDGEVTHVELLYTPDAEHKGLPDKPTIITVWEK
tara:strand:- start:48925 stop:50610 length:1686 start_codon:yes stop_codon:yes gene_type:complete